MGFPFPGAYAVNRRRGGAPAYLGPGDGPADDAPSFSKVQILFDFNGTDASFPSSYLNQGMKVFSVTNTPLPGLLASQAKFGTTGADFNGSSNLMVLGTPANVGCDFGTGEFSIECWVRPDVATTSVKPFIGNLNTGNTGSFALAMSGTGAGRVAQFYIRNGGSYLTVSGTTDLMASGNHHFLGVYRQGDNLYLTVDGVLEGTLTGLSAFSIGGTTTVNVAKTDATGTQLFGGGLDDLRVTKGEAVHTSFPFTPPTAAFPTDYLDPGYSVDPQVIAGYGAGVGDSKQFPMTVAVSSTKLLTFFADGTNHYDGEISHVASTNAGVSWGAIVNDHQAGFGANASRHFSVGINSGTGRIAAFVMTETPDSGNADQDLLYMYSDDDGATWSTPTTYKTLVDASEFFYPRGSVISTSAGYVVVHWINSKIKYVYLDSDMIPDSVGTEFSTVQAGVAATTEGDIIRIDADKQVAVARTTTVNPNRIAFYKTADAGVNWTAEGYWDRPAVTDGAQMAGLCVGTDVYIAWAERNTYAGLFYIKMDRDTFYADPDAAAAAATPIRIKAGLAGGTYEKGYVHLAATPAGRVILTWYEEGTADAGDSAEIHMVAL